MLLLLGIQLTFVLTRTTRYIICYNINKMLLQLQRGRHTITFWSAFYDGCENVGNRPRSLGKAPEECWMLIVVGDRRRCWFGNKVLNMHTSSRYHSTFNVVYAGKRTWYDGVILAERCTRLLLVSRYPSVTWLLSNRSQSLLW